MDAVSIGYFPSTLLAYEGLTPEMVINVWCGGGPILAGVKDTAWGRLGIVMVPRFDNQIYDDRHDLLSVLKDALRLAKRVGADGFVDRLAALGHRLRPRPGAGRDRGRPPGNHDGSCHDDSSRCHGRPPGPGGRRA